MNGGAMNNSRARAQPTQRHPQYISIKRAITILRRKKKHLQCGSLWTKSVFQPICAFQMRQKSECDELISSRGPVKYAENRVAAITFFIYLYFFPRFSAKTQRKRRINGRRRTIEKTKTNERIQAMKKNWWRIIAAHHHKYHAGYKRYSSFFRSSAPTYARRSYEFRPNTAGNFFFICWSLVGWWECSEVSIMWRVHVYW